MLEDIPHDSDLYHQLVKLGKLVFEGRVREEVIFKQLPKGCSALGLLNICSELYGRKENVTYNFLHLTLQEYMGAFYISQLPAFEQINSFEKHRELAHLNMVWKFVAGLTRMWAIGWEGFSERNVEAEDRVYGMNVDRGYVVRYGVVRVWPSVLQCLYDAQDAWSCASVFGQSKVEYHGQECSTTFDAYAVGYFVTLCRNDWDVDLCMNGLGPEVVEMLLYELKSARYGGGCAEKLRLFCNPIKHEGMRFLQQIPHQILHKMRTLDLSHCDLARAEFDLLADTIPLLSSLESLYVSDNPGGNGSTVKLFQALGKHQRLEHLRVDGTAFGRDDAMALSEVVQLSRSLRELDIGSNRDMSPDCVQQLVRSLLSSSLLRELEVCVPTSVYPLDYIEAISDSLTSLVFVSQGASSKQSLNTSNQRTCPVQITCRSGNGKRRQRCTEFNGEYGRFRE